MSLFSKPKPIAPLLDGFTDIHCHVLPGIDDGAKNCTETREMLEAYKAMGCVKIIATPHILKGSYPNTKATIFSAFEKIQTEIPDLPLVETAAAEHMLDEGFEQILKNGDVLPLKEKYVLIEMSYFQQPVNLNELIFTMEHKGFIPVLAHPERYNFINSIEDFKDLKKRGCLFQLNLLSLSKHYGPEVHKKAMLLLKNDLYDFAGTDAHHKRHLTKIASISVHKKNYTKLATILNHTSAVFN